MKSSRKLNRRSFVASVAGGAALGGSATALVTGRAEAQNTRYSGVTDSDTGQGADRPGYGTGVRTQHTDRDTGPTGDAQFHGRGPPGDISGPGTYSGYASGCSDSDGGTGADPGGHGRHCASRPPAAGHCTDSDRGNGADPAGAGRHC